MLAVNMFAWPSRWVGLLGAVALSLMALAFPRAAHAFNWLSEPPPVTSAIDANGVDLGTGIFTLSTTEVTIGQPQAGGLVYARSFVGSGWRDNLAGTINSSGPTYTVSIAGASATFTLASGAFTSDQGRGSTLAYNSASGVYTYCSASGVTALFDEDLANQSMLPAATVARVTQITTPAGDVTSYHYASVSAGGGAWLRLQSVTNNVGYMLHLQYASNTNASLDTWRRLIKATGINLADSYCAPTAASCTGAVSASYGLEASDTIETVTDTNGNVTRYVYANSLRVQMTGIRRPTSASTNHVTISYGASGINGGVSQVVSGGGTWVYSDADSGGIRTSTATNSNGLAAARVATIEIATNRIQSLSQGANTIAYAYDDEGRIESTTTTGGIVTSFEYDGRGNVLETTIASQSETIVTSADYPDTCSNPVTCNLPEATTDALGFTTNYTYDSAHGGVLTVTLPDPDGAGGSPVRPQRRFSYTALHAYYKNSGGVIVQGPSAIHRLTQTSSCATSSWSGSACASGNADETRTTITYGLTSVANNLLPTQGSTGAGDGSLTALTKATYSVAGDVATVDGPLSGENDTTRFRYDAGRRPIGVIGPDPDGAGALKHRAQRATYNADGQVTLIETGTVNSQSDPDWDNFAALQATDADYDFQGRLVQRALIASSATQAVVQTSYDAIGRPTCGALRMNPSEFASLPTSACTLDTAGPHGPDRISHQTYDTLSRPLVTTVSYGTADARTERTATYLTSGVGAGLPGTLADGEGHLTTFEYDAFRRAYRMYYPNPTTSGSNSADYEQFTYDDASNLTGLRRRDDATLTYAYDNAGRMTTATPSANGPVTTFTFDNFARVLTVGASTRTVTYTYDQLSRVLSEAQPRGTMQYQWDLAGRRTEFTFASDDLDIQYIYDLAGEVTQIREENATSGAGLLAVYAYDDLGRRTSVTRGNGVVTTYDFDAASRLTELDHNLASTTNDLTLTFDHNAAGGIVERLGDDADFEWDPAAPGTTSYSANNLNRYTAVGGTSQTYDNRGNLTTGNLTYDIFNRLTARTSGSTATLAYDPVGRLYETAAGGVTARFLYDGAHIVAEYAVEVGGANTLARRYVPGPGIDEPVAWYEGAGTSDRRWLIADEHGSVVAVTNGSGAAITINTYDEYGVPSSSNGGRFQYTGQAWVPEVSLYHYKARAFDPELGRFLQTDPILFAGGMNLYAYVGNDPMNLTDPTGLDECTPEDGPDCIEVTGVRPRHVFSDMLWPVTWVRGGGFWEAGGGGGGGETGPTLIQQTQDQCPTEPLGWVIQNMVPAAVRADRRSTSLQNFYESGAVIGPGAGGLLTLGPSEVLGAQDLPAMRDDFRDTYGFNPSWDAHTHLRTGHLGTLNEFSRQDFITTAVSSSFHGLQGTFRVTPDEVWYASSRTARSQANNGPYEGVLCWRR